jgi:hypothetical protein
VTPATSTPTATPTATPAAALVATPTATHWSLATRLAFRLCVIYFGFYVIFTQMLGGLFPIPLDIDISNLAMLPPLGNLTVWTSVHLFGAQAATLQITQTGSGDRTFDYAQVIVFLSLAVLGTIVWSLVDRSRARYVGAYKWFRLFLRFSLAGSMAVYGAIKAIPLQMPAPSLRRLLEPFGDMSPMGVLWASIGASKGYETFAGIAELTAAVLLFIPGITTFAAMVCFAVVTQIFILNMTYDVPVKLFSFHLLVMCVVLLAPDTRRLVQFLILNRTADPSQEPPLFDSRRARRIAVAAQIVFATYVLGVNFYGSLQQRKTRGADVPKPALFGIWDIDRMTIDGHTRSPLVTDYDRWRRVIVSVNNQMSFQRMDSTFTNYTVKIDMAAKSWTLGKPADKNWTAKFTFQQPARDRLILDGTMDGHALHMDTRLVDHTKFLLLSRGFHWIQETPFNR